MDPDIKKLLAMIEMLVNQKPPEIHIHVGSMDPDMIGQYAAIRDNKNTMDAEGAHDGHVINPGSKYPRPYVG